MVYQHYTPEAVILANGEYPTHPLPLRLLHQAPFVACCDGAANEYISRGHTPGAIIGDCDSLLPEYRERCAPLLHPIGEQETNDQTKSARFLQARGYRHIAIVGATGKREDHTLGNLSLLIEYMRAGMEVRTFTDYGQFIPTHGTQTFESIPGQQVSIFTFGAKALHSEGLVYPLPGEMDSWWKGTLNEAEGNHFTIHAEGDYLLFLSYKECTN
ncbi:MAG: thiamine diphosphokinase [Mediterranea sp.]|jgi:thiamine pyrophosphokinase|nr:thiamine diphosphokinase [Mediterranea sp.]